MAEHSEVDEVRRCSASRGTENPSPTRVDFVVVGGGVLDAPELPKAIIK